MLEPLSAPDLERILDHALRQDDQLAPLDVTVTDRERLMFLSGGDARMMLNGLETAVSLASRAADGTVQIGRKRSMTRSNESTSATIKTVKSTTMKSRHSSRACAGAIPMPRSTGWPGCWREERIRSL